MSNIYYLKLDNLPTCCDMCEQYKAADGIVWCPIMGKIGDKDFVCCPILPAADVVEKKSGVPLVETREQIFGKPGWYRKHLCCANCGTQIRLESWTESRCFGAGTILRENEMPNFCPNCGADLRKGGET